MALTVPSREQLLSHMQVDSFDPDMETLWVDDILQQATDLMYIATNLEADPATDVAKRIVRTGILAMAHALLVQADDKEAIYSPFASERVGTYSYQKMQSKMLSAVDNGGLTGVPWFDTAVSYVLDSSTDGASIGITSENVFNPAWLSFPEFDREQSMSAMYPEIAIDPFYSPDAFGG